MNVVWHGDVSQLTNQLKISLNLSNGRQFDVNEIIPSRYLHNENLWTSCLLGRFDEPVARNSWNVRNALLFQWKIQGGLSVKMVSDWVYLIRFEREDEMHRVLDVATIVVYGDLFCIRIWERIENLTTWSPSEEMFFITIHNLTRAQGSNENLRRYIAYLGDISFFSYPVRKANESYSITVGASIRYKKRLCFSVQAENEMGYTNEVTFQFHHFPNNYCGYL